MKVYVVMQVVEYEGDTLVDVFSSESEADRVASELEAKAWDEYCSDISYKVIEKEVK